MTFFRLNRIAAIAAVALLAACSLIHDDMPECPTGLDLRFVYDYNTLRTDFRAEYVGSLAVYLFDADGHLIEQRVENNDNDTLSSPNYAMYFTVEPGTYQVVTLAQNCNFSYASRTDGGAKFRLPKMNVGDPISKLRIKLDRNADGTVTHAGAALDTLWHATRTTVVTQNSSGLVTDTLSLVRHTKNLTVGLCNLNDINNIDIADYSVTLTADNGTMAADGSHVSDSPLIFTPYREWNFDFANTEGTVLQRSAFAALSFPRLVAHRNEPAILRIVNRNSGAVIANVDLPEMLAKGREAFELENYSLQEYLDRESNYRLDFYMKDDVLSYLEISITALGWVKRIQYADL